MFTHPELLISRLIFVGLVIESFQIVYLREAFGQHGIFSRSHLQLLTAAVAWHQRVGATLGGAGAVGTAAILQLGAATVVIAVGTGTVPGIAAALVCLVTAGYIRMRRQIGGSGAEQLTFIALVTFAIVMVAGGGETARVMGDVFIGAQIVLAYLAAGAAKAFSSTWRRGGAMSGILSTECYGLPLMNGILRAHPGLDRFLGWTVIVWELGFLAILFAPPPVALGILISGAAFHVMCAFLMGLNRFTWAFCGCYPAVFVMVTTLHSM
ncbi:hypothetical protein [Gordonia sp. SL306]|uniref:hypothetical protein n=1 Tax=Gordonia sp. SL306 TaxID=2995145 RepID=UPI00226F34BD|nr:hypothetical protein [Gordonia sp. SL306]WAC57496.1 hypothetical protein OVA31_09825 [Gordonia sp. SL306]